MHDTGTGGVVAAGDQGLEEVRVLHVERVTEMQLFADLGDLRRRAARPAGDLRDVAGGDVEGRVDDDAEGEEDEERPAEAAQQEPAHAPASFLRPVPIRSREAARGSSAVRTPSPRTVSASTVTKSSRAGMSR